MSRRGGDRIETVLRVRRIAQQRALAEVARTRALVADADAALELSRERLAGHRTTGTDVPGLLADRVTGTALRDATASADAARTAALSARAGAVAAWQSARRDERAVERLVERRRAAEAVERARAEQAEADELALLLRGRTG